VSAEPAHRIALERLGLEPYLDWGLRLGEGTGALLMMPLLDAAVALLKNVAKLDEVAAGAGST
jgi:nicotinate-nucleotide--dimethylbenzimidazole phosphoribosyltransferase